MATLLHSASSAGEGAWLKAAPENSTAAQAIETITGNLRI
jgi:hypothetical protein